MHVRFAFKTFCATLAIICTASLLLSCGSETPPPTITITPSSFNVTVNAATGTATGATQIQVLLDKTPQDLNNVVFTITSAPPPAAPLQPGCIGVDQTGIPHCNQGCGASFSGVINATVVGSSATAATAAISCQVQ